MNHFLDAIFSIMIGGFIILMMLQFNMNLSTSSAEMLSSQIVQANGIETGKVLEYDLYKIGYKVTGEKIQIADSTVIRYLTDIDNNDVIDSVRYYVTDSTSLANTTNPRDMLLYRKLNTNTPEIVGAVTSFNLSYFDSTGAELSYINLQNSATRERIKSIRVVASFEAEEQFNSIYQGIDYFRIIRPKNLNN